MKTRRFIVGSALLGAAAACGGVAVLLAQGFTIGELYSKLEHRWALLKHRGLRYSASYRDAGKALYEIHCSNCHGLTGVGGRGPKLGGPTTRSDNDLVNIIRWGVREAGMPAFYEIMDDQQTFRVIAYLQSFPETSRPTVPGDARRGEVLFRSKGACLTCHALGKEGGVSGPELTKVGLLRGAEYLRQKLVDPNRDVSTGFRAVSVKTVEGASLSGIVLNEDTFSVQLRDLSGRVYSFQKSDLKVYEVNKHSSLMPSYRGVFNEPELDDLVAFLVAQREENL